MTTVEAVSVGLLAADWILRLALAVRVIMRRIPVAVTLCWLLLLFLIPVVSWMLYAFVGEPRLGSRRAAKAATISETVEERAVLRWRRAGWTWAPDADFYLPLARVGTQLGGMPPLRGNHLEILRTGGPMLEALIKDIDQAKHHVHLLFYIWQPTGRGFAVGEALVRAVERGVKCRVLVDSVGARSLLRSPLLERMKQGGVQVVESLPASAFRLALARVDLRNHRKIAIVDGKVAYTGSQNVTDETFRLRRFRRRRPWIDVTLRIEGPAVEALQTVFLSDWALDCDEELGDLSGYYPDIAELPGTSAVHVLPSGPGPRPDSIHQAMLAMLYVAREEIVMVTPYFVPDDASRAALRNAALRGVDVTLIVPTRLDARLVAAASRATFDDLLESGVKVLEHPHGLLHAKAATIDRRLAVVGSANFDQRSFWLNFETTLLIYDDEFASQLRFMQVELARESKQIFLEEWRRRPFMARFWDNLAQLFSPLL